MTSTLSVEERRRLVIAKFGHDLQSKGFTLEQINRLAFWAWMAQFRLSGNR